MPRADVTITLADAARRHYAMEGRDIERRAGVIIYECQAVRQQRGGYAQKRCVRKKRA